MEQQQSQSTPLRLVLGYNVSSGNVDSIQAQIRSSSPSALSGGPNPGYTLVPNRQSWDPQNNLSEAVAMLVMSCIDFDKLRQYQEQFGITDLTVHPSYAQTEQRLLNAVESMGDTRASEILRNCDVEFNGRQLTVYAQDSELNQLRSDSQIPKAVQQEFGPNINVSLQQAARTPEHLQSGISQAFRRSSGRSRSEPATAGAASTG